MLQVHPGYIETGMTKFTGTWKLHQGTKAIKHAAFLPDDQDDMPRGELLFKDCQVIPWDTLDYPEP